MPVISNGRRIPILRPNAPPPNPQRYPHNARRLHISVGSGNGKPMLQADVSGVKSEVMMDDLRIVREHYNGTISDAVRIALHLVAKAIREGRMNVG